MTQAVGMPTQSLYIASSQNHILDVTGRHTLHKDGSTRPVQMIPLVPEMNSQLEQL